MTRINVVLLLVLLASSVYLVRLSYDGRRLFTELDRAQAEARQLETDFERLQAERQAQATPLRVEKAAREKLGMRSATPAVTQYVDAPASQATGGVSTASAASKGAP
jgi:cell division protein FtsL